MLKLNKKLLFFLVLCVTSFCVYLLTLSRTVYWEDVGEFITVASTLGISHPSGYPTYTLLGHFFSYLPFSEAFNINLMSAIFASLTVGLIYLVSYHFTKKHFPSICASLISAFSYTFWKQATFAEVYTLHLFFFVLGLFLLLIWEKRNEDKYLYGFCFIFGLSLTNHITSILFLPAFLYLIFKNKKPSNKNYIYGTVCFILGLLSYLYLFIRARMDPIWNWGEISNLQDLVYHISGREFFNLTKMTGFFESFSLFFSNLFINYFWVTIIFLIIGFVGLIVEKKKKLLYFLLLLISPLLIYVLYYDPGAMATHFLPIYIIFAIPMAYSFCFISKKFVTKPIFNKLLIGMFIVLVCLQLFVHYDHNNLRKDYSAYEYWDNILGVVEEDSIILGAGTDDEFISLYMQEIEKISPGVEVITVESLTKDWRVKKINEELGTELNVAKTREEAYDLFGEIIDEFIDRRPVYARVRLENINYYQNLYGPVLKIEKSENIYPNPELIHEIDVVKDENGKVYIVYMYILYGMNEFKNENNEDGLNYFLKAVEIDNESYDAWSNLGYAYYTLGDNGAAVIALEHALEIEYSLELENLIQEILVS
jgi:tetratricopeptide (TPR) repeat protein